jgi:hypothetical protein
MRNPLDKLRRQPADKAVEPEAERPRASKPNPGQPSERGKRAELADPPRPSKPNPVRR